MNSVSIGDMAHSIMLRRENLRLTTELNRLSQELSTGQVADVSRHLKGNFSYLGSLERARTMLEGFGVAANEARTFTSAMQSALGKVQSATSDLASSLFAAGNTNLPGPVEAASQNAASDFASITAALNTAVAGRTLFAGSGTDAAALADGDSILAMLRAAVAGETTVSGIVSVVDDWFNAPGSGFEMAGYLGETQGLSPFLLGENETVSLDLRADAPQLREMLMHTAVAALAGDAALGYPADLRQDLVIAAAEGLVEAQDGLTGIRADLGYAEARIDEFVTRIASEKTATEYAIGELVGVDSYETVARLEEAQIRLESLYTVTVKLSRLSLVEFMR